MTLIRIKRSVTPNAVPTLVDGELALNQIDKKLFSKDSTGTTKFIDFTSDLEKTTSGPIKTVLDTKAPLLNPNFQNTIYLKSGTDSTVRFENTGSNSFTVWANKTTYEGDISIKNGGSLYMGGGQVKVESVMDYVSGRGRIKISRPNPVHEEYADVEMTRDTSGIDGRGAGFGGVTNMFKMKNIIGPTDLSNWSFLSEIAVNGEGDGQHVAIYATAVRTVNAATFGGCFEVKDRVYDPVVGMVNTEFGMTGNGPCGRAQRININLVYGAHDIYAAGDHVITSAIDISAPFGQHNWVPGTANGTETSTQTGRAILLNGMLAKGNVLTGVNLSGVDASFSYQGTPATGVRHSVGLLDTWDSGGKFGFGSDSMIVAMPTGSVKAGQSFPPGYDAGLVVTVAGAGRFILPLITLPA